MHNNTSGSLTSLQATAEDKAFLRGAWRELAGRHDPDEGRAARLYGHVVKHYSGGGRFYHNLRHVSQLLRLMANFEHRAEDYDAVRFAAWFHDAIHDTRRNDNEERSAGPAARVLRELGVPAPVGILWGLKEQDRGIQGDTGAHRALLAVPRTAANSR